MRNYILISIVSFSIFSCDNQAPADPVTTATPVTIEQQVSEPVEPAEKIAAQPDEQVVEKTLTPDMFVAFERFRRVMLEGSCNELAQQCVLPLEGSCGMHLLEPTHDYSANQSVSKEILVQRCNFLDENELAVLKKRTSLESVTTVKNDWCVFEDRFSVSEKNNEFSWSVGCQHVIGEDAGEYARIFVFKHVGGKYKLYRIDCAE